MAHFITFRNEDGTWFGQAVTDGRVLCWAPNRSYAFEFASAQEAQLVASTTEQWRRDHPSDEIAGPIRVREDQITNGCCTRCNTKINPKGSHRCGDCGRII